MHLLMTTTASNLITSASIHTTPSITTTSSGYPYMSTCVFNKHKTKEELKYCKCIDTIYVDKDKPGLKNSLKENRGVMTIYLREIKTKTLILILVIIVIIMMILVSVIYMIK